MRHLRIALDFYRRSDAARNVEAVMGSFEDALRDAEQARDETRELELDMTMALNCIAWIHFRTGRYEEAAMLYEQAVESRERSGSQYEVARGQTGRGNAAAADGDYSKAVELWSLAAELTCDFSSIVVGEAQVHRVLETPIRSSPS